MRSRTYATILVAVATTWLAATMAANVLIDPQAVFGTDLVRVHTNPNGRYLALQAYTSAHDLYDAVLFASSRGNAFDRALLAERLEVRGVANFSVPFGLLTDHLPALEFLLRDKAARGNRLAAVLLVLDADFFGKQPWTNINIDSFQPPQISGESPLKFWWRYLTAFQFKLWRKDLARSALPSPAGPHGEVKHACCGGGAVAASFMPSPPLGPIEASLSAVATASVEEMSAPEIRSDLLHQLDLLRRFVALCRRTDIRLLVAFSPLNRRNVDDVQAPDNERIVDEVARVTPVMDFGRPKWLSERPDLWLDLSHYAPKVATMMIERMLGAGTSASADFGQLKGR